MKIKLLIALLFFTQLTFANAVDSLRTDSDVMHFLLRLPEFQLRFTSGELLSTDSIRNEIHCNKIAATLGVKNWEKLDINNDGRTDLLVHLSFRQWGLYFLPLIAIDSGNNSFSLTLGTTAWPNQNCQFAKVATTNKQTILLVNHDVYKQGNEFATQVDTLIYKFGDLIEYYGSPSSSRINSIQLRTSYCYGTCPVFTMRLNRGGAILYEGTKYVPKIGKFSGVVRPAHRDSVFRLLDYINFDELRSAYDSPITDMQTYYLTVLFADGTKKEIKDYGGSSIKVLNMLYDFFFDLNKNQHWKKLKK